MDLVTLLTACGLAAAIPTPPSFPARPAVSPYLVPVADPGNARLPAVPGTAASAIDRWRTFICEASARFGIPEAWVRVVMAAESGGQTTLDGRPITSSVGAMGLMQVMPGTYAEMRQRLGLGADSYDPHDNILAGVAFLRAMYDRFGYPGFFAGYNAGPARFDDYLLRGIALPDETLRYLLSISPNLYEAVVAMRPNAIAGPVVAARSTATPPSGAALFFELGTVSVVTMRSAADVTGARLSAPGLGPSAPPSDSLFVPLTGPSRGAGVKP
jgi:soluble lytic murein transglycosylase-like protein